MTEMLYFLGRFHVLLLHLPIGILLLAVVLEVASRRERFAYLAPAVNAVWLFGWISAVGTAALGYLHATEGGFDAAAVQAHRLAGSSLAVLALGAWLLRAKVSSAYEQVWPALSLAVVALLFLTGHFGGNLTHGDTYLAQYAPAPVRRLMGVPDEQMPRTKPKDLASADIYLDVVAPAFQQRCSSCHNDGKKKGGLSLARYATLMKGGEHGPVVVAGDTKNSDLVRRISLPANDRDFMPHDGKTPLSAAQTEAVRWWVAAGAPRTASLAALNPPPDIRASLETVLGFRPPASGASELVAGAAVPLAAPAADVPVPDAGVVDALESNGFVVRAIAIGSPLVQVDYTASRPVTDADLAELAKIARQVYALNLRGAGITDAQLKGFGQFENLAWLRLELNPVTNAGLVPLRQLDKLQYLNLHGTKVSDAGLASLGGLASLRELFLWQTAVTPAAAEQFARAHAGLRIDRGFDPKTFPQGPKTIPVVN
ncbi:MAG: c-type cytochrome domain-containing protein [Gammaproteobacteria bacterium]